jgi:DNA-binding transcriptional LysR family regulator
MEFRQLKYFESIVRNKKISKAAEELFVTQPSISTQLKALEKELDCKLLERTAREISLTEPGEVLYKYTQKILKQLKEAQQEIENLRNLHTGEIFIGALPTIVTSWLPLLLSRFKDKYPSISIHIREMSTLDIQQALRDFDIQLGITTYPVKDEEIVSDQFIEEELLVIAPTHFKFSSDKIINMAELADYPFIMYEKGFHLRDTILQATEQAGFVPNVAYESGRIETIRSFVSAGLGVALIPETTVKYGMKRDLTILRVKNPIPKRSLCIATHNNRYFSPAMKEFHYLITDFFAG